MTAKLFMNPNPMVVQDHETIAVGAKKILAKQRRSLPIVDGEGVFVGMLTANCLLYLCLPRAATIDGGLESMPYVQSSLTDVAGRLKRQMGEPVTRCLTRDVKVVHPETPTIETLLAMYQVQDNLPVVEKESRKLVGMISYYNVGDTIMEEVERLS